MIDWVDDHAREFKDLVEPDWSQFMANPKSRWFREGYEYGNLFRFGKTAEYLAGERARRPAEKAGD